MASGFDLRTSSGLPGSVLIVMEHGGARVPAAVAATAAAALTATVTEFGAGGARGHTLCRVDEEFFARAPDGGLIIPVGLVGRVAEHLRLLGIEARVDDRRRYDKRQQPDLRILGHCRPSIFPVLATAAEKPRGVDFPKSRKELVEKVAALCLLFPAARIAIVENNTDQAEEMYRGLVIPLKSHVYRGTEDFWMKPVRRVVMSPRKVTSLNPDDWDVLIGADALAVVARGNLSAVVRLGRLKAYGFGALAKPMSVRERLRVEAVFGAPLLPTKLTSKVVVNWAIPPWTSPLPKSPSVLERKRMSIWGANARNNFVAVIATAVKAGDSLALSELGLIPLSNEFASRRERMRVAVLVESPEHARHLIAHLPEWKIIQHEPQPWRGGWGGFNPASPLRDCDGFDGCIITTMAARKIDSLDVDVLIRADGAGSPLRLPGFPASDRDPGCPQVLVDLADDFDDVAVEATRSRLRGYRDAGWSFAGTPRDTIE